MKTSGSFQNLDEEVKKCQTIEPYEDCTSRKLLEMAEERCNCVPYGLQDFGVMDQVKLSTHVYSRY